MTMTPYEFTNYEAIIIDALIFVMLFKTEIPLFAYILFKFIFL